ncbi:CHAT domain-containing protein [Actinoplanes sp. KI2]|uniref:CHAT domain-containing protein n=1 Tax=Actinoplanes sp. KI2 TaxID=2983315 RepID=UPI0021D58808|nr:CHAT domain-containing protein [Actinoplanes sp. KI2]MCU7728864.1 CHAT domain-containing protein [Actinoplanes sp. KI2]
MDDPEEFLDYDMETPPELIDRGIARVDTLDDDPFTWYVRAWLRWLRHAQAAFDPGRRSAPDDLDRVVRAGDRALAGLRADDQPELRTAVSQLLAEALQTRDADGDLDRAIDVGAAGIDRVHPGEREWAILMNSLANGHLGRYTREHRADDFAAAERALATLFDVGWPDRPSLWLRLGSLHEERFRAGGELADHQRALASLRAGWAEGSNYPMLALSYADVVINSGTAAEPADLDFVVALADTVELGSIVPSIQPQWHYLVMMAHLRRAAVDSRRTAADLRAAAQAAGRLIAHPLAEPGLRAEARVIRATARLDLAAITRDRMADLDPVLADLADVGPQVNPALRRSVDVQLARVLAERARRSGLRRDGAEAETFAAEALGRLPNGSPEQAEVRYHLAYQLISRAEAGTADPAATERGITLLEQVVASPGTSPKVRTVATAQLATAAAARAYYTGGSLSAVDNAITQASEALRATSPDDMNRVAIAAAVATALLLRYEIRGDLADLRWSLELLTDARGEAADDPHHHELALNLAQAQTLWCEVSGEAPADDTLELLTGVVSAALPDDPRRVQALRSLAAGHAMRAQLTGRREDWDNAVRYARELRAAVPANAPFTGLMRWSVGGLLLLAGRASNDLGLVREGTDVIGAAVREPASDLLRGRYLTGYGTALFELHRREPRPGDLDRAVRALREARDLAAGQPGQRGAAEAGLVLAAALDATGDPAAAAETGRAALRARAWQVLLQSGTQDAMTAARQSAADALGVARTALRAGDPAGAWSALETGRGLVLHAATVAATVPELLRRAGESDLARRWNADPLPAGDGAGWRSAAPAMPSDARFRALGVLGGQSRLLEPPSLSELGDALTAVGADALVYLCPGADDAAGLALVVEPGGHVHALDLPALTGDWALASAVQQAVGTRDLGPAPDRSTVGRTLTDVCRTGWDAAIRPLLDRWRLGHSGTPHLVLVPGGALATVPWHATHGDGRWAIDEAAFSYIASARLLVEVARRTAPAYGGVGLVIGNPDTGDPGQALPHAGAEASTIFRTHYAAGRYCGRPDGPAVTATGRGTPDDVLAWLAATGTPPATVLHLACHGVVRADGPASSYLLLADGSRLSAEEIIRAAAARPDGRSPGLVSLAACTTHRAGRAYDEAVTLSTAFLVAGATTAIGSLWPVPDRETARLMVAFHDNLTGRAARPHEALRATQRSMRDRSSLDAWAGFVHLGW